MIFPLLSFFNQAATVASFLEQNGVVEFAALSRMAVRDPRLYLESEHPGGIALATVYMRPALLAAAEVSLYLYLEGCI